MTRIVALLSCLFAFLPFYGQHAFDFISQYRNYSASNYCIYPDSMIKGLELTPPPADKHPFYLSHYGRHGSRYLSNRKGYDIPYQMMCQADSLGQLTETGRRVLNELRDIIDDSEGRWGDLSGIGKQQQRNIARRMVERFPTLFKGNAHIDARSTTVNRCILSMGSFVQQLAVINPKLQIDMNASKKDMWFMNHQDLQLRDSMMTAEAKRQYDIFCDGRDGNPRLMAILFHNPDSVRDVVNEKWLNYYLLKSALVQQNTHMNVRSSLINLFSVEEMHRFWQRENAWWYINYGPSLLNGGKQPYSQRQLLRRLIADADSCISLPHPGVQLRFGHETIMLPLVCLLGINGFDLQTDDLESLEERDWWACLVFPMASNLQFVFYRSDLLDNDIVFKVLLNEQEATLPIPTDIAPYYHWRDFRDYYLRKLNDYTP